MSSFETFRNFFASNRTKKLFIFVLLGAAFVAGFNFRSSGSPSTMSVSEDYASIGRDATPEFSFESKSLTAVGDFSLESQTRLIKTASLSLDVKHTGETIMALSAIADRYAGFVESSSTWLQSDETTAGTVTLRLSVDHFEQALEDIRRLATVVNSESISGQDVTEEYVDLESRLNNLKAEEKQYLVILNEAITVEDLLLVSDYLSTVRGEIETIEGRLKYLNSQTDFSTITVSVYEEASIVAPTADWRPFQVVQQAFNHLVIVAQSLVNGLIWVVIFGIPALILWTLGRRFWHRWHRFHSRKNRTHS